MTEQKKVAVIDTKAGNLFSLFACLRRIDLEPVLVKNSTELEQQDFSAMVIPGQGRFGTVMNNLRKNQLEQAIKDWYLQGKNIVGICVGMQIFFESSEEDDGIQGLSLLAGKVTRLNSPKQPMVGWCDLKSELAFYKQKTVYFVNSFAVKESQQVIANAEYGEEFVAAIQIGSLTAFQFHPEKSGQQGEEVLKQCLI